MSLELDIRNVQAKSHIISSFLHVEVEYLDSLWDMNLKTGYKNESQRFNLKRDWYEELSGLTRIQKKLIEARRGQEFGRNFRS